MVRSLVHHHMGRQAVPQLALARLTLVLARRAHLVHLAPPVPAAKGLRVQAQVLILLVPAPQAQAQAPPPQAPTLAAGAATAGGAGRDVLGDQCTTSGSRPDTIGAGANSMNTPPFIDVIMGLVLAVVLLNVRRR